MVNEWPDSGNDPASSDGGGGEKWRQVLQECGSFNLRKASRVVTQLYDEILQPTGLRSTQVVVLVTLAAEGEMSISRLARELVTSPSTLSRNLQPLERDGLIHTASKGRQGKLVRLTTKGTEALEGAEPYWQRAQEKFVTLIGAQAWADLNRRLGATVAATTRL
jgi:DNA-binding MarR family transcriptional regulator